MASQIPVKEGDITAPTPQNTPLQAAPITQGLSRPTVPAIDEEDEDVDSPATAAQAAMFGLVQGRLATLLGKSSGYVESLPAEVRRSVEGLKGVQVKYNELQQQYKREAWELEKKYLDLQKPLFERRSAIVAGSAPATAEEVAAGEKVSNEDDPDREAIPEPSADDAELVKGVPEFWLTALRNHVELNEIITDRDAEVLKHLTDVRLSYTPNNEPAPGYKLEFIFEKNEWFENATLEKTYLYQPEVGYSGDFIYERAIGTEIKWKSDEKDLTKTVEVKKQRNKNTNRTRLVRKTKPADSFFNFFNPPVMPNEDEQDDLEDDLLGEIEMKLEVDYQIGEDFKEKIIPRAVDYFTGKALEYESMDEDDDFEDMDSDDDDDDASEDSDSDEPAPRRRGKGGRNNAAAAAAAAGVDAGECKQQ